MELLRERFTLATEAESYIGEYLSRRWMYNNIFKFSDAEIAAMKKEIDKEQDDGEITPDDFGNAGAELKPPTSNSQQRPSPQPQPNRPDPNEQMVLDDTDIVSNFAKANILSTKTVSQLLEKFSEVEDE